MANPVHATCVAWGDNAVLITGEPGTGKSGIGLLLMSLGCSLVADDRVILENKESCIWASCPNALHGMIEARGVGLLNADHQPSARIVLVVDLDQVERDRLPKRHEVTVLGCVLPLIYFREGAHFAPAILQFLKAGWSDA